jgi:hypothetical protein
MTEIPVDTDPIIKCSHCRKTFEIRLEAARIAREIYL